MSDRIQSLGDAPRDRSDLNVGGRTNNNKMAIVALFLIVAFGVLAAGLYFAFKGAADGDIVIEKTETNNNFIAGSIASSLEDSDDYFEQLKKEKKRKERLETIKKLKAEKAKIDKEIAKEIKPVVVKRTGHTPKKIERIEPKLTARRSSNKKKELTPKQRKMQGRVLVSVRGEKSTPKLQRSFSKAFSASAFEDGYATHRQKGSLDFLLIHGTSLPCALYTQIISDYSGFVTCRITQDVYSANGAALLVEKGSLVSGTQSVAMLEGKARIFTSWADIETPLGASIRIDSLGTGQLGAAGIDAWIDNHYQQRFGGAILLSFVDDAMGALSDKLAEGDGVGVDNSTKNGSDMASKALESSINIKPTGYAFIGQRINILVARDIDMSSIYRFVEEN
jgi:type IV secretion system protein VirB10